MSDIEDSLNKIKELEHTADVLYEITADDLLELFELAALSMFNTMTDIKKVVPRDCKEISAEGFDLENLLYRWLENLLIDHDLTGYVYSKIMQLNMTIFREDRSEKMILRGVVCGEKFDKERHDARLVVKAVTYSQMFIHRTSDGRWRTYIVYDI